MATKRQIISEIRSMHRLLQADATVNDRTILREAWSTNLMLIKQQTNLRRLWSSPTLFTTVPCIEFQKVPIGECCEFTSPKNVAKSVEPIPKIGEGIWGLLIQFLMPVDRSVKFIETTPVRYSNLLKLGLPNNKIFYWLFNGHLYISNPDTETAILSAFFEEDVPNALMFPGEDCVCHNPPSNEDLCRNPLDLDFKTAGYLIDSIKTITSKKLLQTYFNIPIDQTNNNLDEQAKNTVKQS